MHTKATVLAFISLLTLLFNTNATANNLFTVHGSNTIGARLAPACAREFLGQLPGASTAWISDGTQDNEYVITNDQGLSIHIAAHGSSTGFKALEARTADLAMSSRRIKTSEHSRLAALGDLKAPSAEHTVAIDGLAILVHPSNPVSALSISQIGKIFSGQITNWKELNGTDIAISIHARDNKSGTWDTFKSLVLGKKLSLLPAAKRYESNDKLSDQVANDPSAIGFAGLASVRNAKLLAVSDDNTDALKPNQLTVATEDYPLSRRLYLYQPPNSNNDMATTFIEFCQSQTGQNIVSDIGFISQNIKAIKQPSYDNAPPTYQELTRTKLRLSVNFRFEKGSSKLDNKALKDIDRLVDYFQESKNNNQQLTLVGFSDTRSRKGYESLISQFRALAVQAALMKEGVPIAKVHGLGAFMPVASNGNIATKSKNGRVEVWITPPTKTAMNTSAPKP